MGNISYLIIIGIFMIYYLLVIFVEKKFIYDPRYIIEKFLAVVLAYTGISLIYFSITGNLFFAEDISEYFIYIFIIGFIALFWAIPTLFNEFGFFSKFVNRSKKLEKKLK